MSATKEFYMTYDENLDAAWSALEEAIVKMKDLNDLITGEDGEWRYRVPRADASLLNAKIKELRGEVETFHSAREAQSWPPILPGELRFACS